MEQRMMILLNTPVHSISTTILQNVMSGITCHQAFTGYEKLILIPCLFLSMHPPYQAQEKGSTANLNQYGKGSSKLPITLGKMADFGESEPACECFLDSQLL